MTRRRLSDSRRNVRVDPVARAMFMLGATLCAVGIFGGIGLLAMSLSTAILLSIGGGLQLVVSQRLVS